jgi:hypothetical protein
VPWDIKKKIVRKRWVQTWSWIICIWSWRVRSMAPMSMATSPPWLASSCSSTEPAVTLAVDYNRQMNNAIECSPLNIKNTNRFPFRFPSGILPAFGPCVFFMFVRVCVQCLLCAVCNVSAFMLIPETSSPLRPIWLNVIWYTRGQKLKWLHRHCRIDSTCKISW